MQLLHLDSVKRVQTQYSAPKIQGQEAEAHSKQVFVNTRNSVTKLSSASSSHLHLTTGDTQSPGLLTALR